MPTNGVQLDSSSTTAVQPSVKRPCSREAKSVLAVAAKQAQQVQLCNRAACKLRRQQDGTMKSNTQKVDGPAALLTVLLPQANHRQQQQQLHCSPSDSAAAAATMRRDQPPPSKHSMACCCPGP